MDTEYLKKVGLYILSALLSLGVVFYLGYHIWQSVTREVETEPAMETSVHSTLETDGYIFRSETVLAQSGGGSLVPSVSNGEKVAKNSEVARMYSAASPSTVSRITEIDQQIALLSDSLGKGEGLSLKDSSSIDESIYNLLRQLRGGSDKGSCRDATTLRTSFVGAVNKRMILSGAVSDFSGAMEELESEKNSLTGQLGALLSTVTTPVSGYYYAETDGYESVFDPNLLEDADFDKLYSVLSAKASGTAGAAGKTVTDSLWYMVCVLDRTLLAEYENTSVCTVTFDINGDVSLEMNVERTVPGGDSFALILSSRMMPEGFDYTRMQPVQLVRNTYTGLRVPASSVRVVDGMTGVYVLEGSTVRFRLIKPVTVYEGMYIVETDPDGDGNVTADSGQDTAEDTGDGNEKSKYSYLYLHDTVIVKGKGLYDGKVLAG